MKHTDTPCEELHQSRFKRRFKISQNYIVIIKNPRIIENMMVQKKKCSQTYYYSIYKYYSKHTPSMMYMLKLL